MTGWTNERVELLKALWAQGQSASQIAKRLGGVTRSGVLGKIHRLGQADRGSASPPGAARAPAIPKRPKATPKPALTVKANQAVFVQTEPRPVVTPSREDAFEPLPGSTPRPFWERPPMGCRWPVGPDAWSCSLPGEGRYCPVHTRLSVSKEKSKASTANELARSLRRYV